MPTRETEPAAHKVDNHSQETFVWQSPKGMKKMPAFTVEIPKSLGTRVAPKSDNPVDVGTFAIDGRSTFIILTAVRGHVLYPTMEDMFEITNRDKEATIIKHGNVQIGIGDLDPYDPSRGVTAAARNSVTGAVWTIDLQIDAADPLKKYERQIAGNMAKSLKILK